MADSITDRLRGLLASDVYSEKGRLRSDDLLVRERVGRGLGEATARIRDLVSELHELSLELVEPKGTGAKPRAPRR